MEIWTKAKIDQFCQIQEKKTPELLFPLQNVFCFTLPNASERFFERLFSTPERPKGPERPQNRPLLGLVWT